MPLSEDSVSEVEEPHEVFVGSENSDEEQTVEEEEVKPASEAEDMGESFVPETAAVDQEFQRNVPVDIISENEFEQDEPEVKPVERNTPFTKAMKLKRIIKKKSSEEE